LRQDNTLLRLYHHADTLGIVPNDVVDRTRKMSAEIEEEVSRLKRISVNGSALAQILRRPEMTYEKLPQRRADLAADIVQQVEINVKYEGYIERELRQIEHAEKTEHQKIPAWVNYDEIKSLRFESREKLKRIQPDNLGQASRISGVNPSDIAILSVWIKRGQSASTF
jgi:tRNA uridine 5-carboxymethylaminomethyl modification enzyme